MHSLLTRRKGSRHSWKNGVRVGLESRVKKKSAERGVRLRTIVLRRRTLEHEDLRCKHVHWLTALVQCTASYFDDTLVRFRTRRHNFLNLAFTPYLTPWPLGPCPCSLS